MKKIFSIECDADLARCVIEEAISNYLTEVRSIYVKTLKVRELPQEQEFESFHTPEGGNPMQPKPQEQQWCECKNPTRGIFGLASKCYLCRECGLPIKPQEIKPLELKFHGLNTASIVDKLNQIIAHLNRRNR